MRYSALAALFASSAIVAYARPEPLKMRDVEARDSCDILSCVQALAPTIETCAMVGTKVYDVPMDVECLQEASQTGKDLPKSCQGCPEKYGVKLPSLPISL